MITIHVNGASRQINNRARYPASLGVAGRDRFDWHKIRLRYRAVRRLHGAYQRYRHAVLLGADRLSSANIQIDTTQRLHADELRAIRYCGKRVFMMQATEDRFHEDERIRRQAMAGF